MNELDKEIGQAKAYLRAMKRKTKADNEDCDNVIIHLTNIETLVNNLPIALPDTPDDEIYDFACDLHRADKILNAALLIKRHTTMNIEQAKQYCYSHFA